MMPTLGYSGSREIRMLSRGVGSQKIMIRCDTRPHNSASESYLEGLDITDESNERAWRGRAAPRRSLRASIIREAGDRPCEAGILQGGAQRHRSLPVGVHAVNWRVASEDEGREDGGKEERC